MEVRSEVYPVFGSRTMLSGVPLGLSLFIPMLESRFYRGLSGTTQEPHHEGLIKCSYAINYVDSVIFLLDLKITISLSFQQSKVIWFLVLVK